MESAILKIAVYLVLLTVQIQQRVKLIHYCNFHLLLVASQGGSTIDIFDYSKL